MGILKFENYYMIKNV